MPAVGFEFTPLRLVFLFEQKFEGSMGGEKNKAFELAAKSAEHLSIVDSQVKQIFLAVFCNCKNRLYQNSWCIFFSHMLLCGIRTSQIRSVSRIARKIMWEASFRTWEEIDAKHIPPKPKYWGKAQVHAIGFFACTCRLTECGCSSDLQLVWHIANTATPLFVSNWIAIIPYRSAASEKTSADCAVPLEGFRSRPLVCCWWMHELGFGSPVT